MNQSGIFNSGAKFTTVLTDCPSRYTVHSDVLSWQCMSCRFTDAGFFFFCLDDFLGFWQGSFIRDFVPCVVDIDVAEGGFRLRIEAKDVRITYFAVGYLLVCTSCMCA